MEADPKPLGQRVPEPLHERIEALCDRVYEAGHRRPAKADLVAALLLEASGNADALHRSLERYYAANVGDALLEDRRDEGDLIQFPERKPGPRTGRA